MNFISIRERNKVLARKTRCKKREELDLLREQVEHLQAENENLRVAVKSRQALAAPDYGSQLLMKEGTDVAVNFDIQLPENVVKMVQMVIARAETIDCTQPIASKYARKSFCITNATAPDNPIVYASPGFMELTGYDMHSILGHNCRFLQGPETDRNEVNNRVPCHPSYNHYFLKLHPFSSVTFGIIDLADSEITVGHRARKRRASRDKELPQRRLLLLEQGANRSYERSSGKNNSYCRGSMRGKRVV